MRFLKFMICMLSAAAIAACASCAGKPDSSKAGLPDYDAQEANYRMTITGWGIPAQFSAEQARLVADSGVNVMFFINMGTITCDPADPSAEALDVIAKLGEAGVGVYVKTATRDGSSLPQISNFANNETVLGMVTDEPTKAEIDAIASRISAFDTAANGKTLYTNLFPSFAEAVTGSFENYEGYLEYYCGRVLENLSGEKWLSADRYPLTFNAKGEKTLDTGWLSDVEAVARVARKYEGVKTNFFIQTMPYGAKDGVSAGAVLGSRDRVPTYEDIRLQEYALAAFGYDSISLFCYGTPAVGPEFTAEQSAMIDREGNKTPIYDAVKRANGEILNIDHVLGQFDWKGVFTNDGGGRTETKDRTRNASFGGLRDRMSVEQIAGLKEVYTSGDTLMGVFRDQEDNLGLMIVNYNETSLCLTDEVELTFDTGYGYNGALCYIGGEKTERTVANGKLNLELGPGEGVFVIPYVKQ